MTKKIKEEECKNLTLFDTLKKEVTYRNDFSNAIFKDFSLKEKQLLLFLIAGIDDKNKTYNYNPKQIKSMLNMNRQTYSVLSNLISSLQRKPLVILKPDKKIISISLFDSVVFNPTDKSISVIWGNSAKELFKNLKGNFSKYFLKNIGNLKMENSIEFYLRAESNLYKKSFEIYLDDIKTIFDTNYSNRELKRSLINKSINDINNNTDICIESNDIKEGRKIVGFSFNVNRKNYLNDNLISIINKIKKNIYINKSGLFNSSEIEKTLHSLFRTFSEEELEKGLELCYKTIKEDFKTIVYLETAIKFALENKKEEEIKLKKKVKEEKNSIIARPLEIEKKIDKDNWFDLFNTLDLIKKSNIEKKALEEFIKKNKNQSNFIITMKQKSPTMYYNTLKDYILKFMIEDTSKKEKVDIPKRRGRRKKLDMIDELDKVEEITKNERTIKAFMKKKYGKEKASELFNSPKYENIMFEEYINLLKEKEKNKNKK